MIHLDNQQTFLNYFQNELGITRTEKFLAKLNKVVPWNILSKKINGNRTNAEGGVGRPRIETIKMIKILFLQGLYNLSDPEAEDQIRDRNSFQKFLGITKAKDIPDETTICRFRNELTKTGNQESIFTMTQFILAEMGFNVQKGYMQDGTIIEAPKGKKNKEGKNTRDKDASFTKKNGRTYHGFKGHIETSKKGDFIMNTTYTTAKVHDSQAIDALMTGDEKGEAYGDSAYGSKKRNEFLEINGIVPKFNEKGVRGTPLNPYQKEQNRIKSGTRAKVEHPFATLKTKYGNYKVKYRGLVNNAMHWFLSCAIYNFEILARRYT